MTFHPKAPLSRPEFVALMAMLMATIAFSMDAMLPALPRIAAELSPDAPNEAQLIISFFVLGMGVGTIFAGPLSDSFGRKPMIAMGSITYCAGAALAWHSQTLEMLLIGRALQGFGAAGPRVVALAIIRDLYSGRAMAQLVSFVIVVFTLVPAIAPTFGAVLMSVTGGWRGLFPSFMIFSLSGLAWLIMRQPETLPPEKRRPPRLAPVGRAAMEVLRHPVVRGTILVQVLAFGMLFANLSSVQMVFDKTFGLADSFHLWFAVIAVVGALGGFVNSKLVMRRGMRWVIEGALTVQVLISAIFVAGMVFDLWPGDVLFWAFLVWTGSVFAMAGLTLGNINALALEPMGHIAGTAASVVSALGSIGAALLAAPVGLAFDGTPLPLASGVLLYGALALVLMKRLPLDRPTPI